MNKSILSLLLVFFLAGNLFAGNKKIGFTAGVVGASQNVTGNKNSIFDYSVNPVLAFSCNLHGSYYFNSRIGIGFEPGYIGKGGRTDFSTIRYHYIQAPIFCNFLLNEKLALSAGGEFNYLVARYFHNTAFDYRSDNLAELGNRTEFGLTAGVAYEIFHFMDVGLRYSHALNVTEEVGETDNVGNPLNKIKFYNHYTQLYLRFKFQP